MIGVGGDWRHRGGGREHGGMSDAIRPFTVTVSDDEIADLRDRLARTRWAEDEPV